VNDMERHRIKANLKANAKDIEYEIKKNGCWECVSHAKNKVNGYAVWKHI